MPTYQDKEVTDEYLQGLIGAYREGQKAIGGDDAVEDSDQVILDRLEAEDIDTKAGAKVLGEKDTRAK